MLNIAICDDSMEYISLMKRIIMESGAKSELTYFSEYTSGSELVFELSEKKKCDLLILDMQLGDMSGDDVAEKFREIYPYAVLVFCSGEHMPTVRSFKATPFRYLLKSYSDEEMIKEMKEILREVEKNSADIFLVGHYRHSTIKVKISNIMYITNAKRGSRVFVTPECDEYGFEGKILIDEKLADLQEKYEKYGFEFASVSYIVNMRYVRQISANEMILITNERLSVTRKYYKSFREKFAKHLAEKY